MGSIGIVRIPRLLLNLYSRQSYRTFSLSASSSFAYTSFSHSKNDGVGPSDFVFRHSFRDGPFAAFKTGRLSGIYRRDPRQENVILQLQALHQRLNATSKSKRSSRLTIIDKMNGFQTMNQPFNWFSKIAKVMQDNANVNGARSKTPSISENDSRGLYLHGGVGVGKTMLMDLFVESKSPSIKITRSHFHDFMLGIHAMLKEQSNKQDPLAFVADMISAEARVLALDELFVTDVADAMIINRLFKALWDNGMVLITTSNRKPDDLYLGGLQRDLFLPFIDNLKKYCVVHNMQSEVDYRKLAHYNEGTTYFLGDTRNQSLKEAFEQKSGDQMKKMDAVVPLQMGRTLRIPLSAGPNCLFTFEQLCEKPLGSADYLGLCRHFHTVFIQDIPQFKASNKSATYRFVKLIDILYDHRIRLLCSAENDIYELFSLVISHSESLEKKDNVEYLVDDKLSFAKDRAVSRLIEMQSMEYLADHAHRHAPELLLALAELEDRSKIASTHQEAMSI